MERQAQLLGQLHISMHQQIRLRLVWVEAPKDHASQALAKEQAPT